MNSLDYQKRLYVLESKINGIKSDRARMDLTVMTQNPRQLITELSKEEVEVRRQHKITIRYQELSKSVEQSINDLENFITFALLKS